MLTLSILTFALCVTSSFAQATSSCEDGHGTGFYPNKFNNVVAAYDGSTPYVDTVAGVGDSFTVTTTNTFGELGNTVLTVFDNGIIVADNPAPVLDLSGYSGPAGTILNQAFITAVWYPTTDLSAAQVECKLITRAGQFNGNGDLTGGRICYLERMEEDILAWDWYYTHDPTTAATNTIQPIQVDEMLVCTWALTGNGASDGTMYSQVVIGYTSDGATYASLFYEMSGTAFNTPVYFKFNGDYATAGDTEYAAICGSQSLAGKSNMFCGKTSQVMFSLNAGDSCGSTDTCVVADLHPDLHTRKPNCNELRVPTDTCYADGRCEYTYDSNDPNEFNFMFHFDQEVVTYDSWEVADLATMALLSPACIIPASNIVVDANNGVTISKTWTADGIALCGVAGPDANGDYQVLIHNYDSNEATGSLTGNHVWKMGSRQYLVTCRPSDLITKASIGVTVGKDVYETTMSTMVPTLTMSIGNKLDIYAAGYDVFSASDVVAVGRPLYPVICYSPGTNWVENVHPYGVRGFSCQIGNTPAFDDKVKTVILNDGCTNNAIRAFRADAPFVSLENAPFVYPFTFCTSMGAIRAARWVNQEGIYFQCQIDYCTNTAYYDDSYCKNSCTGLGYDAAGNRKKRQTMENTMTVQAVLRVTDTTEAEAQTSCADINLAISAIVVLVVLLLVATVITIFLMVKMQSMRRKAYM